MGEQRKGESGGGQAGGQASGRLMETHSDADSKEHMDELLADRWLTKNCLAITAYNDQVTEYPVFSDGQRGF